MTDPHPDRLDSKPRRAEAWQPDNPTRAKPAHPVDRGAPGDHEQASDETLRGNGDSNAQERARAAGRKEIEASASPEADIPRDALTGNSLHDKPLLPGEGRQSDG